VTIDLDASRNGATPAEVETIADALLAALDQSKTPATFFIPRELAEKNPGLTRRITDAGHEAGSLTLTTPSTAKPYSSEFGKELQATRVAIEDASGIRVRGHRNSAFAVDYESEWAYDVLVDQGFEYDSSRFPRRYPEPGHQPVPRTVHAVRRWGGTLLEIPVSTADVLAMRMQLGSAGSIRGIPLPVWRALVDARQSRGEPLVLQLRASELKRQSLFGRGTSTAADGKTLDRVSRIVGGFPFTSVSRAFSDLFRFAPTIES